MSPLAHIALLGWIPAVIALFSLLRSRTAVIAAFLIAWLLLPNSGYNFQGIPDYTKVNATCVGVLLAALIFDSGRLFRFRPSALDIPMLLWIVAPLFSSLSNGLGLYDGLSSSLTQIFTWALPWFIGRLYLTSLDDLTALAKGIFIAAVLYMPLCWIEMRLSPQLHNWVYGFSQHTLAQAYRAGGWRPMVFMQHGLALAAFLGTAVVCGYWLWRSGAVRTVWGLPTYFPLAVLSGTFFIARSFGALVLTVGALVGLSVVRHIGLGKTAAVLLAIAPVVYMGGRVTGLVSGDALTSAAATVSSERSASLRFRLNNENLMIDHSMNRPLLGWGGWGRGRVFDDAGQDVTVTDGLWIITLSGNGLYGLAGITMVLVLPGLLLLWRIPGRSWRHPAAAGAVALATVVLLHMVDNLFNAMINPVYLLAAGGIATVARLSLAPSPGRGRTLPAATSDAPTITSQRAWPRRGTT
jgi:hypothetical protein